MSEHKHFSLTKQILFAMLVGALFGVTIKYFFANNAWINTYITNGAISIGGEIFINILKMLVVPIVFVSIVCGASNFSDPKKLGRVGGKAILLYLCTTAIAITLGLTAAHVSGIGNHFDTAQATQFHPAEAQSAKETLIKLVPPNPLRAMVEGNMLQIIVFSLLLGMAIALSGGAGKRIAGFFNDFNDVLLKLIHMVLLYTPIGVFCLIAKLFITFGFSLLGDLIGYFVVVISVLIFHLLFTNTILLRVLARLNPLIFFKKMYPVMLFAFSTSSSNATIPLTLETVHKKLGVKNSIASFVVPLGATINMDGTAIMQGVAAIFISHVYNIHIGLSGDLTIVLMATLASIGTAGVPGIGMITLAMVFSQVGLPVDGIALIIGIDRLVDMTRTAINVTGDAAISCVIAKSEKSLNLTTYEKDIEDD